MRTPFIGAVLAVTLVACAARAPIVQAPAGSSALLAGVVEAGVATPLPDDVSAAIAGVLKARALSVTAVDPDTAATAFAQHRTTRHRMAWTADQGDATLIVLVESRVEFYSQLSGRFRWTVDVTASVAPESAPEDVVSSTFSVPVFLQFHHEKEAAAAAAAAPVIARHVAHLVDASLGGPAGG